MNKNEISLNIIDETTTATTSDQCSLRQTHHYIPKDLFSCLICYETFGVDQQELVALKCGHMFCASCIKQWFKTNKGFDVKLFLVLLLFFFLNLVCPTCRKRCWLKDILYIDVSTCIVAYGKKKIENLSIERDRLKNDIEILKSSIENIRNHIQITENQLKTKQRLLYRLKFISKRKHR
jgi:hypothetical protein